LNSKVETHPDRLRQRKRITSDLVIPSGARNLSHARARPLAPALGEVEGSLGVTSEIVISDQFPVAGQLKRILEADTS